MLNHRVERKICTEKSSIGTWTINGVFQCYTLEDRDREPLPWGEAQQVVKWKVAGATAIPRGRYPLVLTFSTAFNRMMPLVDRVPNFMGIRVHWGNVPEDTEGCILVGRRIGAEPDSIIESKQAFLKLYDIIANGGREQWLTIS